MLPLVLASQSPRRREILGYFSLPFICASPHFEESHPHSLSHPEAYVCHVAKEKALSLKEEFSSRPLLAADTIVCMEQKLFAKPRDAKEAYEMLSLLSGKWHQVYTGICVVHGSKIFEKAEMTNILFHELSEPQKKAYHQHFFFLDKAGGYAIQKAGSIIIKRLEGCYYNVMGLPLNTVGALLNKIGIDLWCYLKGH